MFPDQLITTELWDIIVRLANFRAAMASKGQFGSDHAVSVLEQLDSDLEQWSLGLPFSWTYQLRTDANQIDIYTSRYHMYPGFSMATAWNQYRVARCLVNELLLTYLDSSYSQAERNKEIIRNLCTDICASVPYFLRRPNQNDSQSPGIGAMDIMWALSICGNTECLPEGQRLWAIEQLENIGRGMWITQALTLASVAKSKIANSKCRERRSAGLDSIANTSYDRS
jgi:hypothetical protein